jgi:hypothetical protein
MVAWIIRQPISPPLHVYKLRSRASQSRTRHFTIHSITHFVFCSQLLTVVVLATRAGVHEAANLRALVSWPIGGRRVCLALARMGTVLDTMASEKESSVYTARSEQINATAFRRYLTLLEIKLLKRFRKRNGTVLFLWAVKPSPAPNPIRFSGIAERLAKVPYSHTATQPQI